jgi:hypothetical protein
LVTPATVYANVIQIKLGPAELILEFGCFFPSGPNPGLPSDYKPDIRVVVNGAAMDGLLVGLQNAVAQRKAMQPDIKKPTVGFTPQ